MTQRNKKQNKLIKQTSNANSFQAVAYELVEMRKHEGAAPVTIEKLIWI